MPAAGIPDVPPSRGTVLSIYALAYFASFGNPLVMPLLPFIAGEFSLSPMELGLMISMYALPGACIIPLFGVLEDRLGRRPILLGGMALCAVSSFMCFLSSDYGGLVFWRACQGLAVTPLEALYNSLVTDNFRGEERVRQIGRCASILYIGVATFPLLSGAVLALAGWRAAFLLPVFMGIPVFLLWLRRPMRYDASSAPSLGRYLSNVRTLVSSRTLLSLYGARMLMALIMFGVLYAYLPALVTDRLGASPHLVGPMFSVFSSSLAVSCLSAGRIVNAMPMPRVGLCCGFAAASGLLGMWLTPSVALLPAALVLYGGAQGMLTALVTVGVAGCATPDTRATILSLFSTLFRASQTLAPLVCGWLFVSGGFTLLYGAGAAAACGLGLQCRAAFRRVTGGAE